MLRKIVLEVIARMHRHCLPIAIIRSLLVRERCERHRNKEERDTKKQSGERYKDGQREGKRYIDNDRNRDEDKFRQRQVKMTARQRQKEGEGRDTETERGREREGSKVKPHSKRKIVGGE